METGKNDPVGSVPEGSGAPATNNPLSLTDLPDNLMPQAMPTTPNRPPPTLRPGAYRGNPGSAMERNASLYKGGKMVLGREGDTVHEGDSTRYNLGNSNETTSPPSMDEENSIAENHQDDAPPFSPRATLADLNASNLVEARMVSQPNLQRAITQTEEVHLAEEERKQRERKMFLFRIGCTIFALLCLVVGIAAGVLLGIRGKDSEPTLFPTFTPSETPTSAPTGALDLLLQELPEDTQQSLENYNTPQWKAYDWLLSHPSLEHMEEWRKVQLFALACFFFAMEGPNWPKLIRDNWLIYTRDECNWFSNEFGAFFDEDGEVEDDGKYFKEISFHATPCNHKGEFQNLFLAQLQLSEHRPFVPPEIALLTSMSILALPFNEVNASLVDFLPTQIYQMPNLTWLDLHKNALTGAISTEYGLLTKLKSLGFYRNSLTGPIPTELGLLTNMEQLVFSQNTLEGPIPSELGLISNATILRLHLNNLNGPIPTQLGLLTNMKGMGCHANSLTGSIPTELGLLTSIEVMNLHSNSLTGPIPTELRLLTSMEGLWLNHNFLTGLIPTELGLLTNTKDGLDLSANMLEGAIPSELGLMSNARALQLQRNSLTESIPTELGLMTSMLQLVLHTNALTGPIPSQLGQLSSLGLGIFNNNSLTGTIPDEFNALAVGGTLVLLILEHNELSGVVSENLCSLGMVNWTEMSGSLSFDCNDKLCGCKWCPCSDVIMENGNGTALMP